MSETRLAALVERDTAWEACPYATFFHSRARAEDWAAYTAGVMRSERPSGMVCGCAS